MKELNIEEKARRYDEALARARNIVNSINVGLIGKDSFEAVFPELKESEDERRKDLIIYLRSILSNKKYGDKFIEDWIAWLEKMGEHLKFCKTIQIGDRVTRNEGGVLVNMSQLDRIAKKRKKQGEQKSVEIRTTGYWNVQDIEQKSTDKVEPKFKVGDTIQPKDRGHEPWQIMQVDILDKKYRFKDGYVIHFSQEDAYELVKKKLTAWSEEDEEVLDALIRRLEGEDVYVSPHLAVECLKSLKDRIQPKQEILEKLEEWLDEYVSDLADVDTASLICSFTNYLDGKLPKSLRPQNSSVTDEELVKAKKEAYNDALDKIEYHSGEPTFDDGWSAAIWYLKKRNAIPQSQWKPSDEQMRVLDLAIRCGINRGTTEEATLVSLFNDLTKLK